jgi:hypothetical protein
MFTIDLLYTFNWACVQSLQFATLEGSALRYEGAADAADAAAAAATAEYEALGATLQALAKKKSE